MFFHLFPDGYLSNDRILLGEESTNWGEAAAAATALAVPFSPNLPPSVGAPIVDDKEPAAEEMAQDGWGSS